MSSIQTNIGSMGALQTLRGISSRMEDTQTAISSGFRVNTAADNAAYWSIATTMRSEQKAMSAAVDGIGITQAVLDVTENGLSKVLEEVTSIRNLVISARNLPPLGADAASLHNDRSTYIAYTDVQYDKTQYAKLDTELKQHLNQIRTVVDSSSFSGLNLLKNTDPNFDVENDSYNFMTGYAGGHVITSELSASDTVVLNYKRSDDNDYSGARGDNGLLDGFIYDSTASNAKIYPFGQILADGNSYDTNDNYFLKYLESDNYLYGSIDREHIYSAAINSLEDRMQMIQTGIAKVGALQTSVQNQSDFLSKMIDTTAKGIGRLVDADMNEESTKLKAIQTQQQLGLQALNIANSDSNNILQLFR